jgi:hypothetical protein
MQEDRNRVDDHSTHSTVYNGPVLDGGLGGINAGRDINVSSTRIVRGPATDEQLRAVQEVARAANEDGVGSDREVRHLLAEIQAAVGAPAMEPKTVRRLLVRVREHAGTAGALFGAVQVALMLFD